MLCLPPIWSPICYLVVPDMHEMNSGHKLFIPIGRIVATDAWESNFVPFTHPSNGILNELIN